MKTDLWNEEDGLIDWVEFIVSLMWIEIDWCGAKLLSYSVMLFIALFSIYFVSHVTILFFLVSKLFCQTICPTMVWFY